MWPMPKMRSRGRGMGGAFGGDRKVLICSALLVAGLLPSCREDSAASAGDTADTTALAAELDALGESGSVLRFSGTARTTGEFTTGNDARYAGQAEDVFRPARGGRADYARRGSNADGPYAFAIYTDAVHEGAEDDVVRAWMQVVLPEGAGPGSYGMAAFRDAAGDQAQVTVAGDGYGWQFSRDIAGTLLVEELGETLSAAWEFEAHGRGEEAIEVSGAVKGLPFSFQPETRFSLTANGETEEHFGRIAVNERSNGRLTVALRMGVYLELPPRPVDGTYPVKRRRESEDDVTVTLSEYSFDAVEGEVTLERSDDVLAGRFHLTTAGTDVVTLEGSFDALAVAAH